MAIPPQMADPKGFAATSDGWSRSGMNSGGGTVLPVLSMGMSDDFEVAIEEGATVVRVGRAIFTPAGDDGII